MTKAKGIRCTSCKRKNAKYPLKDNEGDIHAYFCEMCAIFWKIDYEEINKYHQGVKVHHFRNRANDELTSCFSSSDWGRLSLSRRYNSHKSKAMF